MTCFTGRRETHYDTKMHQEEKEVQWGVTARYLSKEERVKQDDHREHPRAGQGPQRGNSALQKN